MQAKTSLEIIEMIEMEMKELRQMEALEAQAREMAASKRERVMMLWKMALAGQTVNPLAAESAASKAATPVEAVAAKQEPQDVQNVAASVPVGKAPVRPFGSPGAPRDLLTESGTASKQLGGNGASALVNGDAIKRAPSAQQVFQSLNRLVGGSKGEPLKN